MRKLGKKDAHQKNKHRVEIQGRDYVLTEKTKSKEHADSIADSVRNQGHFARVLPIETTATEFGVYVDGKIDSPSNERAAKKRKFGKQVEETAISSARRSSMLDITNRQIKIVEKTIGEKASNPNTDPDELRRLGAFKNALVKYKEKIKSGRPAMLSDLVDVSGGETQNLQLYTDFVKDLRKSVPKSKTDPRSREEQSQSTLTRGRD